MNNIEMRSKLFAQDAVSVAQLTHWNDKDALFVVVYRGKRADEKFLSIVRQFDWEIAGQSDANPLEYYIVSR